jgi:hypothetical protein
MCSACPALRALARWALRVTCVSLALLILGAPAGILRGQEATDLTSASPSGFRISSLSGYAVYYSSGLPEGSIQPTGMALPSDLGLGGSAQLDWTYIGEKSRVMFSYTPSYTGRLRFSAWDALNHSASFNAARQFGRWKFGLSAGADLSSLSESVFSPTVFASVAAVPATFNDLASALLTGSATNAQLASLLTGAPLVESPARNLFFGDRMFTSAAQTSLAYAPTPRTSVKLGASMSRSQHLSNDTSGATQNDYLIPRTTSVGAVLDVSYSRSSRTQLDVSVNSNRIASIIQDVYSTMATASLGRKMGRRWLLQVSGGMGKINPVRNMFAVDTALQPVVSGSLGFRTQSQTFLGSYGRSVSDSYGLGAASTTSVGGSWRWGRHGRSWWIESSVNWQELGGAAFANSSGWRAEGGFGRSMGSHIALLTQYVYLRYSQQLATVPSMSQTAVRVSMIWNRLPHAFQ